MTEAISLTLPLSRNTLRTLHAGDACLLSGPLYTLRDAGHQQLLEEMSKDANFADQNIETADESVKIATSKEADGSTNSAKNANKNTEEEAVVLQEANTGKPLPYDLSGQSIFYAGPSPAAAGLPFGAIGPTTASRMDFATPQLLRAGVVATIGKGKRSPEVKEACRRTESVYFIATGGVAALLASCVISSETVAYPELGTEALRRITVKDLPVFVGVDTQGNDIYEMTES